MKYNDNIEYKCTFVQLLVEILIVACFSLLCWNIVPFSFPLKLIVWFFVTVLVGLIIKKFTINLLKWNIAKSIQEAILVAALILLLIPLFLNIQFLCYKYNYILTEPEDWQLYYKVSAHIKKTNEVGSVGHSWSYHYYFNDEPIENNRIVNVTINKPFTLKCTVCEYDEKTSDVGSTPEASVLITYRHDYSQKIKLSQTVRVTEKGGRRYADSYADFDIHYTLKRVLPPNYSYEKFVLDNYSDPQKIIVISLIIIEFSLLCTIISFLHISDQYHQRVVIAQKKIKEQQANELIKAKEIEKTQLETAKRQKADQEAEKIHNILLNRNNRLKQLLGENYQQDVIIPDDITFTDDWLPIKGTPSDIAPYGSYTAYITLNGMHYHMLYKCCGAVIPIHIFEISSTLKPCSKCRLFPAVPLIPSWYQVIKDAASHIKG